MSDEEKKPLTPEEAKAAADVKRMLDGIVKRRLTPDEIKVAAEHVRERIAQEGFARSRPDTEEKTGVCAVCSGTVISDYAIERTVDIMNMPIGPAGNQFITRRFMGYHCSGCGLVYKFLTQK